MKTSIHNAGRLSWGFHESRCRRFRTAGHASEQACWAMLTSRSVESIQSALLESLEGDTETCVVDAQALAEGGPRERLAGAAQGGAHEPRRAEAAGRR